MLAPGALLQNRYRIVRLGARNPASTVYAATDERFGSGVVVKEWSAGGADASRSAFAREAMILNRAFHPALAHVFDAFAEDGALYVVEQDVPGEPLAALVVRGERPSVDLVLAWADRVLDALDLLHSLVPAVVHANVTPATIYATPRGDAVLTEFGFCVESGAHPIGHVAPYAPHEQVQGAEIDPRADVYGLSATIYHLLAGAPPPNPFERLSAFASGGPVVLRLLDELNPEVPAPVALAIHRGLALRREERPASAAAMREELRDALSKSVKFGEHDALETRIDLDVDEIETPTERDIAKPDGPTEPVSLPSSSPTDPVLVSPDGPTAPVLSSPDAPTEPVLVAPDSLTELIVFTAANAPTVALDPRVAITEVAAHVPVLKATSTSLICRTCGAANDSLRLFCPFCGSLLRADRRPVNESLIRTIVDEDPPTEALSDEDLAAFQATSQPPKPLLAQLLVLEGEEPGRVLGLGGSETDFGRAEGDHTFPLDMFMSGRHARIVRSEGRYGLRDVGSRNGTYLKIRGRASLSSGDVILAGTQLVRFDPEPATGRSYLRVLLPSGSIGESHLLVREETTIGRTRGDLIFPDDFSVAEQHARVVKTPEGYAVEDLGTRNGTFLRLNAEAPLVDGDIVIIGKHIFRFEISEWEDDYSTLKGF